MNAKAPLWTCPKCGQKFAGTNMAHSCFTQSIDEFFKGKKPALRGLYDAFLQLIERCAAR